MVYFGSHLINLTAIGYKCRCPTTGQISRHLIVTDELIPTNLHLNQTSASSRKTYPTVDIIFFAITMINLLISPTHLSRSWKEAPLAPARAETFTPLPYTVQTGSVLYHSKFVYPNMCQRIVDKIKFVDPAKKRTTRANPNTKAPNQRPNL